MAVKIATHRRDLQKKHMRNGLDTQMRDYQAAMVNNLTASWLAVNDTAAQVIYKNLLMLRGRSREQGQNNDYAKYFLTLLKANVVGPQGFNFQARALDPNGKPDLKANGVLDLAFTDWMRPKHCHLLKKQSLTDLERCFISNVAADGEILCRVYRGRQYGKYGFQIRFIDPGYLDIQYNDSAPGGNRIEMSIEYDSDDVAVAYYLIKPDSRSNSVLHMGYRQSGVRERVPASDMLHCYLVDRVDQPRGLPWMSTALLRLNMQGGWEEASLVNARAGAGKMGFFEETGDLSTIFEKDEDSGEIIDESDPGTWHRLPPGVKVSDYDPTYPNNEFGAFNKSILRGISAGLGVAYHTLANDLEGVNYSSGRLGSQNERDIWTVIQDWMKDCFLYPIYEMWIDQQLVQGNLKIGGGTLRTSDAEKYMAVEFQGRRWSGVDPKKESNANAIDYQMRTKSLSQIIRDKAQDPDKVWREIAEDNKKLEALGIKPEPVAEPGTDGKTPEKDKPGDDDSGKDE